VTYANINAELLLTFPELGSDAYREAAECGPFVVFGDVFNSYVREIDRRSESERARIAGFLNAMEESGDGLVEDLLKIEVLNTLLESAAITGAYWPFLSNKVRWALTRIAVRQAPEIELPTA
jgi:hypothetical protein